MRAIAWISLFGVFVMASAAPQEQEAVLGTDTNTVDDLPTSSKELKTPLTAAIDGLKETRATKQNKLLGTPQAPRGERPTEVGNVTLLGEILDELRQMNGLFREHLAQLACPPPFFRMGTECFYVILEDVAWENARSQCQNMGADLAVPSDLNRLKVYVGTRYPRKNQRNFWIGGRQNEKIWEWLSGEPIEESLWYTNEPSGNGVCLGMFDGWEHPLTDFPCENERRAICERDLDG